MRVPHVPGRQQEVDLLTWRCHSLCQGAEGHDEGDGEHTEHLEIHGSCKRRGAAFPGSCRFYVLPVFAQWALITLFHLMLHPQGWVFFCLLRKCCHAYFDIPEINSWAPVSYWSHIYYVPIDTYLLRDPIIYQMDAAGGLWVPQALALSARGTSGYSDFIAFRVFQTTGQFYFPVTTEKYVKYFLSRRIFSASIFPWL